MTRRELEDEYAHLVTEMRKSGLEPTVSASALDVFTDGELRAVIRAEAMRLMRFRRHEGEQQ